MQAAAALTEVANGIEAVVSFMGKESRVICTEVRKNSLKSCFLFFLHRNKTLPLLPSNLKWRKKTSGLMLALSKVTNMVVTHFYMPADDAAYVEVSHNEILLLTIF